VPASAMRCKAAAVYQPRGSTPSGFSGSPPFGSKARNTKPRWQRPTALENVPGFPQKVAPEKDRARLLRWAERHGDRLE